MTDADPSLDEQFHRIAYRLGGRYISASDLHIRLLGQFRSLIERYRRTRFVRELPAIHVEFFDNPVFNAFATERSGQAFIGLSRGLVDQLHDAFDAVLGDENVLRALGLTEEALIGVGAQADFEQLPEDVRQNVGGIVGMARSQCALAMTTSALHFVFWHELGHIVNGHTLLHEYQMLLETDSGIEKQMLETDADAFAVSQSLNELVRRYKSAHQLAFARIVYSNTTSALCCWYLSILIFFRFQVRPGPILENIEEHTHPPPILRHLLIVNTLLGCLMHRQLQELFAADRALLTSLQKELSHAGNWFAMAEQAYANAFNNEPDFRSMKVILDGGGQAYVERLLSTWANSLYERLVPLARTTLPKPQSV